METKDKMVKYIFIGIVTLTAINRMRRYRRVKNAAFTNIMYLNTDLHGWPGQCNFTIRKSRSTSVIGNENQFRQAPIEYITFI